MVCALGETDLVVVDLIEQLPALGFHMLVQWGAIVSPPPLLPLHAWELGKQLPPNSELFCVPPTGGHSIDSPEPIFGLVVAGLVDPAHVTRNSAAQAGDVLILTKPLGVGVMTTALKKGVLPDAGYDEVCCVSLTSFSVLIQWQGRLCCNRPASKQFAMHFSWQQTLSATAAWVQGLFLCHVWHRHSMP